MKKHLLALLILIVLPLCTACSSNSYRGEILMLSREMLAFHDAKETSRAFLITEDTEILWKNERLRSAVLEEIPIVSNWEGLYYAGEVEVITGEIGERPKKDTYPSIATWYEAKTITILSVDQEKLHEQPVG